MYRSLLASRRVLVVLDNARDAQQVRPLLPGSSNCVVLVTSRDQLGGLVAVDGARTLPLDVLSTAMSRRLIARRLGQARVDAEPAAVDSIIQSCGQLPLALSVVAARASINPWFSLTQLADELEAASGTLDPFDGGEQAVDVRAVFSWSYQGLTGPVARLFRQLALTPGPDVSTAAAASLAGDDRRRDTTAIKPAGPSEPDHGTGSGAVHSARLAAGVRHGTRTAHRQQRRPTSREAQAAGPLSSYGLSRRPATQLPSATTRSSSTRPCLA